MIKRISTGSSWHTPSSNIIDIGLNTPTSYPVTASDDNKEIMRIKTKTFFLHSVIVGSAELLFNDAICRFRAIFRTIYWLPVQLIRASGDYTTMQVYWSFTSTVSILGRNFHVRWPMVVMVVVGGKRGGRRCGGEVEFLVFIVENFTQKGPICF